MAFTESRVFGVLVADMLDGVASIDVDTNSIFVALYNNTGTPDRTVAASLTAYNAGQWTSTNEVDDGTEWDAGGEPLANAGTAHASGVSTIDGDNTVSGGTSATLSNVYGYLVYDGTVASPVADQGICYNYLGGANSVVNGTFTVIHGASGIATFTT